ncbi:hypothetical protein HYH03_015877 [Edaphochlamys debaryana]|uniref:Uncharacterized protein n=1 Tax=Edaphochlamys debaryana TaxID=47281 RepID=A0A835XNF1_9CHLO|nr:hypothetical protein HYH03_015877 [Edaphochlamys debaryana]|eukprot:KAG2485391.1 hypothetical protein HYH03_015877 [Edaphochlamys debaryana]
MALASKVATRPAVASRRGAVVVRASAESRRAVLGGMLASAVIALAPAAKAVEPIGLIDERVSTKANGFYDIYEARDDSKTENQRQGRDQARGNLDSVKARAKESEARIDSALEPFIKKNYWTKAREELRLQVGTLRFDLNTLAEAKGTKAEKKAALELRKSFIKAVEDLDFALREKDEASAAAKLTTAKAALDAVLASVL